MRFFLWISSGVAIVRATALENLFDDWDSSSNAALLTSVDETPIDMSTSSDFLPQYSSGEEPLNSSDFDSLASNSLPPEGIDSVFMADKPDSCSTSIDSKRLRRDGGPVCGTQDPSTQDPSTDQVPTSNWDSSPADTPFPMTNYDRRSCQPERYSYLVCSSSDQSTIENAAAFLILGLYDCTRGKVSCASVIHRH